MNVTSSVWEAMRARTWHMSLALLHRWHQQQRTRIILLAVVEASRIVEVAEIEAGVVVEARHHISLSHRVTPVIRIHLVRIDDDAFDAMNRDISRSSALVHRSRSLAVNKQRRIQVVVTSLSRSHPDHQSTRHRRFINTAVAVFRRTIASSLLVVTRMNRNPRSI